MPPPTPTTNVPDAPLDLFDGAGPMGDAFRSRDWRATALGSDGSWPPSLRTSVQHILWSHFPNLVLWGQDLLQLYNQRYHDLMGERDFARLGQPARESSPLDWLIDEPIYARVKTGETVSRENARVPVKRDAREEMLLLTLSYSPIFDEAGSVGGVLVTIFDSDSHRTAHAPDKEVPLPVSRQS